MQGRAEPLALGVLQPTLQLTLAAPVMGRTQCSAGGGPTRAAPLNPPTPQSHPKSRFPLFLGWVALLMGVGASLLP